MNRKVAILAVTMAIVLGLDVTTKRWALETLSHGESVWVLAGTIPLTLAFNKGAAFSLNVGEASRYVFLVLSLVALAVLVVLYRNTRQDDTVRLLALSLIGAGAVGNLIDRIRWDRGVVDFIGPIDLGFMYWPIFNVADMAITSGAILLVISLWLEERRAKLARQGEPATSI
ncbi:MAG TPA: signal peptidase II [Longimicrobiales bacterium]|nr:signal peptidase II [Longimicrobiales bacterium]